MFQFFLSQRSHIITLHPLCYLWRSWCEPANSFHSDLCMPETQSSSTMICSHMTDRAWFMAWPHEREVMQICSKWPHSQTRTRFTESVIALIACISCSAWREHVLPQTLVSCLSELTSLSLWGQSPYRHSLWASVPRIILHYKLKHRAPCSSTHRL